MHQSENYTTFDSMCWPTPNEKTMEIGWNLRYANRELTKTERLIAASIFDAYRQMVTDTQKKRNQVCKVLKGQLQKPDSHLE